MSEGTDASALALNDATSGDMLKLAWTIMRQLIPPAQMLQAQPKVSGIVTPGHDPRDERLELLSLQISGLTSCLNMVMVSLAKDAELRSLPRAERRRRSN